MQSLGEEKMKNTTVAVIQSKYLVETQWCIYKNEK